LAKKLNLSHVSRSELGASDTNITRSVRLASGRFAMMQMGKEFALVPWKQAMQMRKNRGMAIDTRSGPSR